MTRRVVTFRYLPSMSHHCSRANVAEVRGLRTERAADLARRYAPIASSLLGHYVTIYEAVHQYPELSGREFRTAMIIRDALLEHGYTTHDGVGGTGVVGTLHNGDGPVVAIRCELDALPIREATGLPYASTVAGDGDGPGPAPPAMHACGHDAHIACAIAAAHVLSALRDEWRGTIMVIAQPAEETLEGARAMLADGLYERFGTPDVVMAQHVLPTAAGYVGHLSGAILAAASVMDVELSGRGGHASAPHLTVDPIVLAAAIVTRLQSVVAREVDPLDPAVVTVGTLHAGQVPNVIPDTAHLQISLRALRARVHRNLMESARRVVLGEVAAGGADAPRLTMRQQVPAVHNERETLHRVRAAHEAYFGPGRVGTVAPSLSSDDFGLFGRAGTSDGPTPRSLYWFIGSAGSDTKSTSGPAPCHHPQFRIDPHATLRTGTEAMVVAALRELGDQAGQ
jgi:amidohydrolase